jgi:hypothetical protein
MIDGSPCRWPASATLQENWKVPSSNRPVESLQWNQRPGLSVQLLQPILQQLPDDGPAPTGQRIPTSKFANYTLMVHSEL